MFEIRNQEFIEKLAEKSAVTKSSVKEMQLGQQPVSIIGNEIVDKPMDSFNTGVQSTTIAFEIEKAIASKNIEQIENVLKNLNTSNISSVMKVYTQETNKSFVLELADMDINNNFKNEIFKKLKSMSKPNSYASNEILATELLQALNSNDKKKISQLLDKEVTPENIRFVYAKYIRLAKSKGEIAATEPEKKRLSLTTANYVKIRAKRPESLFQGVMNNENLTLKEKEGYLLNLIDKFAQYAKTQNISDDKIIEFKKFAQDEIKLRMSVDQTAYNNAYELEDGLMSKLLVYLKN